MKNKLLLSLLFISGQVLIATEMITPQNFPDPQFRQGLSQTFPGGLDSRDIGDVHSLYIYSNEIQSIEGVALFTNLKTLIIYANNIERLPELPPVEVLGIRGNPLEFVPTLPVSIQSLELASGLESLPSLTYLPNLKELIIWYNRLTELPAFPDQLTYLDITFNQLETLNIIGARDLQSLISLWGTIKQVGSLPGGLKQLILLDAGLTHIEELPLTLEELSLGGNQFQEVSNLARLSNLNTLSLDYNPIHSIVHLPPNLSRLNLSGTLIENLPTLPDSLFSLDLQSTRVKHLPALPLNLKALNVEETSITELPPLAHLPLVYLNIQFNHFRELPEMPSGLRFLIAHGNDLTSLPALPASLEQLLTDSNQLAELPPLKHLVNLRILGIGRNQLRSIPELPEAPNLFSIDLSGNQLTSVPKVSQLSALTAISISSNQISDLRNLANHPTLGFGRANIAVEHNNLDQGDCGDLKILQDRVLESGATISYNPQNGNSFLPCTLPHKDADFWLPHITPSDSPFQTEILLENVHFTSAALTLQPYDREGHELPARTVRIDPGNQLSFTVAEAFPDMPVSHISILGGRSAAVRYIPSQDEEAAVTVAQMQPTEAGHRYTFYPNSSPRYFEGVAIVNPGEEPLTVTISHEFSLFGDPTASGTLVEGLAPKAKSLLLLDDLADQRPNSPLYLITDKPALILYLRGTMPGALPAILFEASGR